MKLLLRSLLVSAIALGLVALAACGAGTAATAASAATPRDASAAVTSPDGLWSWSRPLPLGYPAGGSVPADAPRFATSGAIAAPSPGRLFVATTVSDLLTTGDGGASWSWSPTGAVSGFGLPQSLDFVSADDGWVSGVDAAGENGVLLTTSDGGASWGTALSVPGVSITSVRFGDRASGWFIGGGDLEMEGWVASCTTDGGKTWSAARPLPQDSGPRLEYSVLEAFAPRAAGSAVLMQTDELVGGVGDGTTVWRTVDGGDTWTVVDRLPDARISDLVFASAKHGWAAGRWLWHTVDGGATWKKVRSAPARAHVAVVGADIWVVGNQKTIHSSDGGAAWRRSGRSGSAVTFADSLDGWIADGARYEHTDDGGVTWSMVTRSAPPGVTVLSAVPGGAVWAAARQVVRSTDEGAHWRVVQRRPVNAISAISSQLAWAVGDHGRVLHTADGGRHWRSNLVPVMVDRSPINLTSVCFVDARHGWATGNGRVLLRTTDGGRHWACAREARLGWLPRVTFGDAKHGIAISSSRTFLVTGDGGSTWTAERLPAPYAPTAALMVDSSHALIIARDRCFSSSDGGASWRLGAAIPASGVQAGGDYVSIARSGPLLGAVDRWGDVAISSDEGATWTNEGQPMGGAMTSVQFVGGDVLMIAGSLGVMTRDLTAAPLP